MASGIVQKGEELDEQGRCLLSPSANDGKCDRTEGTLDISDTKLDSDGEEGWSAQIPRFPVDGIFPLYRFPRSRHRDGSIYRGADSWKEEFGTANRNESKSSISLLPFKFFSIFCRQH